MFKTICALLKRKTIKPSFPVKPEIKKELVKKATTRKPKKETASHPIEVKFVPAKKKAIKKANKRLIKSEK
jgi:hypothetical protein